MTIEQRVAKLERQNKWMKRAGGLALAAVACVVLMGQGKPKELPDLRARSLTITDAKGKRRISLHATEAGPRLDLYDANGHARVNISYIEESGQAAIMLLGTKALVFLNASRGSAHLQINDKDGNSALDGSALNLDAAREKARARLSVFRGSPSVELRDKDGSVIWQAPPK